MFRLVEIEKGKIELDGVDLRTIGLTDVRGRRNGMFILPQDPAVFSGTIQSNLDPFCCHGIDDIIAALKLVKFPGADLLGENILTQSVDEGGSNLSAGEKQLLCLARAMLANPRLLVLDEASSALDRATDEFVQKMLRSQFPDTTCEFLTSSVPLALYIFQLLTIFRLITPIDKSTYNCPPTGDNH